MSSLFLLSIPARENLIGMLDKGQLCFTGEGLGGSYAQGHTRAQEDFSKHVTSIKTQIISVRERGDTRVWGTRREPGMTEGLEWNF